MGSGSQCRFCSSPIQSSFGKTPSCLSEIWRAARSWEIRHCVCLRDPSPSVACPTSLGGCGWKIGAKRRFPVLCTCRREGLPRRIQRRAQCYEGLLEKPVVAPSAKTPPPLLRRMACISVFSLALPTQSECSGRAGLPISCGTRLGRTWFSSPTCLGPSGELRITTFVIDDGRSPRIVAGS